MLISLIVFFAIVVQSVTGFGAALVSMPLLAGLLGIQVATPLVALVLMTANVVLLRRYWHALSFTAVKRLAFASVIGIPLGVYILRTVDGAIVTTILGIILVGYALYALLTPHLPELKQPVWAYFFGFLGGVLSGAYSTSGPSVIVYATCRRWEPATFKGNLQAYFLLNSLLTLAAHTVGGNFTAVVLINYLWALPAIGLGLLAGRFLDGRLDPGQFRKVVLVMLIVLGIRLILA